MGKYLIKRHCFATEILCQAGGRVQDYYYGNNPMGGYISHNDYPKSFQVEQYGFNSVEEAKPLFLKMAKAAEEENKRGQWEVTVEIVEVN